MRLNLYDNQMNRIAIIGDRFISCMWSEGYNTVQPFTMELQATDDYKRKVKTDCYVGRDDRKTLMVIKTVQIKSGRIIASGKQAARCLDDVPFIGTIVSGSEVDVAIKNAYDAGEKFEGIEFSASALGISYNHQISNKTILGLCENMCQETDIGFRTVRSNGSITVEFYRPEMDPNLIFAEKYGNLTVNGITMSTEKLKNHAIVLGEGEEAARWRVHVDLSNGAQKRSIIIDARDITREEAETDASYQARLEARGIEKLLQQRETLECAFTPLAREFGTRYDLGDILTVLLSDYGMKLQARVARFTQIAQENKTTTTIEVGTITVMR